MEITNNDNKVALTMDELTQQYLFDTKRAKTDVFLEVIGILKNHDIKVYQLLLNDIENVIDQAINDTHDRLQLLFESLIEDANKS